MFYDNISDLQHTLIVGILAYFALVLLLRVSRKRTLSKWNAFDLVVTVALGSTLATILLSKEVALTQGVVAFSLLVVLQFVITWLSVRSTWIERLIKARPTLLLYQGQLRHKVLKRERVTEGEIRAALREQGIAALEDVEAVILETDGEFSIIRQLGDHPPTALSDVEGYPPER